MLMTLQDLDAVLSELQEVQTSLAENMDINNLGELKGLPEFNIDVPALESAVRQISYLEDDIKRHGVCRDDIEMLLNYSLNEELRAKLVPAKFTKAKSGIGVDVALEAANATAGIVLAAVIAAMVAAYIALVKLITVLLNKLFGYDKKASSTFSGFSNFKGASFTFEFEHDEIPMIKLESHVMSTIVGLKVPEKMPGFFDDVEKQVSWFNGESSKLTSAFQLFARINKVGDKLKELMKNKGQFKMASVQESISTVNVTAIMSTVADADDGDLNVKAWKFDLNKPNKSGTRIFNYNQANAAGILDDTLVKEADIKGLEDTCNKLIEELEDLKDTVSNKIGVVDKAVRAELSELLGMYNDAGSEIRDLVSCFGRFNTAVIATKVKLVQHFGKVIRAADGHYSTFIKCMDDFVDEIRTSGHSDDLKDVLAAFDTFEKSKKYPEDYKKFAEDSNVKNNAVFKKIIAKRGVTEIVLDNIVNGVIPVEPELLLIGTTVGK